MLQRGLTMPLKLDLQQDLPTDYTDADEMTESTAGRKKNKKSMKANNLTMAYLHMTEESGKATGFLAKLCDDDYPNGKAYLAWDLLKMIYAKTDMLLASKLIQEFNMLRLK